MGDRRTDLAEQLLGTDDPVCAIADLIADHEMRLDALARRIASLECRLKDQQQ